MHFNIKSRKRVLGAFSDGKLLKTKHRELASRLLLFSPCKSLTKFTERDNEGERF